MELFEAEGEIIKDSDFASCLQAHSLKGRSVLVYSRLMSFGRIRQKETVSRILALLIECIGGEGTLCVPCYTFSAYNKEIFDPSESRSRVGALGDLARVQEGFVRTIHPVYSHACWGKHARALKAQDYHTCFGSNSFFDLFARLPDAYILMLGTTLSAVTFIHYYDQHLT